MSAVTILATVRPKPGMEAEVEKNFHALLAPTHAEPGCELYALHRAVERPGELIFVERWSSAVDLAEHAASAHIAACTEACQGMLAEPVEITHLEALPGGDPGKAAL